MKIKRYLFTFLLGLCATLTGQTITILDAISGKRLEGVSIRNINTNNYTTTNVQGQADISFTQPSSTIEIRSVGYKTDTTTITAITVNNFNITLTPLSVSLDEIVISAVQWQQSASKLPFKLTSISSESQTLLSPPNAADLLGISDQVFIQKSQQGGGSPMIRGFAANRLLYTIDGVRMNTAIYRSGNLQNVISLDPFAIENTEITFGPGSVRYGSDAIGGVMSFYTHKARFSDKNSSSISGNITLRHATANEEKTGHIELNVGRQKWAFVSSLSSNQYGDLHQGANGPEDYIKAYYVERKNDEDHIIQQKDPLLQIPTTYSQYNIMQKVRYRPNADWDINYGFHYSETSPYGRYDRHNRTSDDMPKYAEWSYGPQKWIMNNISITHQHQNKLYDKLSLIIAKQSFEESRISRNFNATDRKVTSEKVDAYSINIDFKKEINAKHSSFYGIEYVLNDIQSTGVITDISSLLSSTSPSRYPNAQWSSIGLYFNHQYNITNKHTIQSGLRYNHFIIDADFSKNASFYHLPFSKAHLNDGQFTGSIGGTYRPSDTWLLRSNFGTGFRAPNIDDMGKVFDSEPGAITIPNPNLKSEYIYSLDIGIAKTIKDAIKLELSSYASYLDNALVRRNFSINGQDSILYEGQMSQVQAIQNASHAFVYGGYLGVEIKLPEGFSLSSKLNYQIGNDISSDGNSSPSRHAAPLFGTTRFNFNKKQFQLQLYAIYQGEKSYRNLALEERNKDEIYAKDNNGNNYAPSWYTINARAAYTFTNNMSINLAIENISDQRYRPYSSGVSGPGRNFIITLSYHL